MDAESFLRTMIEETKYSRYADKYKMLTILRNSKIRLVKTRNYSRLPNQCHEDMELRVPIPIKKEAQELKSLLRKIAEDVYEETDEYDFGNFELKPKIIESDDFEHTEHNVVFDEIRDTIIQGIRGAKYTIWAAVAWITDRDIFRELMLRKKAGVNIRIITSDEESNRFLIDDLENNLDVVKIPLTGPYNSNRLHDKFCIIDFEFVMHGSYNWSNNARGNDETLATALDRDFVRSFADEFMKLYNGN